MSLSRFRLVVMKRSVLLPLSLRFAVAGLLRMH
jgi:hypothetical protein